MLDTQGLSEEEVQRAIRYFLKERERVKICSKKRREKQKASRPPPPPPKEPKEPKKYYVPTGRPRGRPRKVLPDAVPEVAPPAQE